MAEMEGTAPADIHTNIKKYIKDIPAYEGGEWTRPETINKIFITDLKKYQLDAHQVVQQKYKDPERLRLAAEAATEIYDDLKFFGTNGGDEAAFATVVEKARRLAVYGFQVAKYIDKDTRDLSTKALRLPESVKYLEDEDDGRSMPSQQGTALN